jgi:hypothetical protein
MKNYKEKLKRLLAKIQYKKFYLNRFSDLFFLCYFSGIISFKLCYFNLITLMIDRHK